MADYVAEWNSCDSASQSDDESEIASNETTKPVVTYLGKLSQLAQRHNVNEVELYNLFRFFAPQPVTITSKDDIFIDGACNVAILESLLTNLPWAGVAATYVFTVAAGYGLNDNITTVQISPGHQSVKTVVRGQASTKPALRLASKLKLAQVKASIRSHSQAQCFTMMACYHSMTQEWFQVVWTRLNRSDWSASIVQSDDWVVYQPNYDWVDEIPATPLE